MVDGHEFLDGGPLFAPDPVAEPGQVLCLHVLEVELMAGSVVLLQVVVVALVFLERLRQRLLHLLHLLCVGVNSLPHLLHLPLFVFEGDLELGVFSFEVGYLLYLFFVPLGEFLVVLDGGLGVLFLAQDAEDDLVVPGEFRPEVLDGVPQVGLFGGHFHPVQNSSQPDYLFVALLQLLRM